MCISNLAFTRFCEVNFVTTQALKGGAVEIKEKFTTCLIIFIMQFLHLLVSFDFFICEDMKC